MSANELSTPSRLHEVVGSPAFSRLVIHFCLRPFEWVHFRELKRRTGLANRSLQLQIARLLDLGMIHERRVGRTVQYSANTSHQGWGAMKAVLSAFATPVEVFSIALAGVAGIEQATLRVGRNTWGKVLDLMIIGTPQEKLGDLSALAGQLCGYRVRFRTYVSAADAPDIVDGVLIQAPGEDA